MSEPKKIYSTLLFICSSFVINVIIAQGFNMQLEAKVKLSGQFYNDVWGYEDDNGNEFAIVGTVNHVLIYNVNDCSSPQLAFQYTDGAYTTWRDFKDHQNVVYGVGDQAGTAPYNQGLQIINMQNYSVNFTNAHFARAHNIFIDTANARLYVAGSNTVNRGLIVYNISNPLNPVHLASVHLDILINAPGTNMYVHDVYVKNHIVYTSNGAVSSMYKWDFSDLNNIQFLGSYTSSGGYNHSGWTTADEQHIFEALELPKGRPINIYVPDDEEQTLIKIGDFKEPLEFPVSSTNRPHNPFVHDNKLFISYYEDGVQVFDITNPASPQRIAYYDTYQANNGNGYGTNESFNGCWGVFPFFNSGCILASDISEGFFTLTLDLPEPTIQVTETIKINEDFYAETADKGVVLRSPKGYCFRIGVSGSGVITLTRIVCQSNTVQEGYILDADLDLSTPLKKFIIKGQTGTCYSLSMNTANQIIGTLVSCPTASATNTRISGLNLIIDTYTKGVIIRNPSTGICYRLTATNEGNMNVMPLNICP